MKVEQVNLVVWLALGACLASGCRDAYHVDFMAESMVDSGAPTAARDAFRLAEFLAERQVPELRNDGRQYDYEIGADRDIVNDPIHRVDVLHFRPDGDHRLRLRVYREIEYVPRHTPAQKEHLRQAFEQMLRDATGIGYSVRITSK